MQRTTRRLVLTDAGRNFFARSADQVDALLRAADQIASDADEVAGRVRVGALADFFNWFPADAVARFTEAHPKVRLEFELNDARVDLLGEGIDVAMRGADHGPSLIARKLGTSRATLVASPVYLAARGQPALPRDLAAHDCITAPARGGPKTVWRLAGPRGAAAPVEVDGPFQVNTASAQLAGALAGLGIALLPAGMSASHLAAGRLKKVLPDFATGAIGVRRCAGPLRCSLSRPPAHRRATGSRRLVAGLRRPFVSCLKNLVWWVGRRRQRLRGGPAALQPRRHDPATRQGGDGVANFADSKAAAAKQIFAEFSPFLR
ncbi:hypothetical protein DBA29_25100 [Xenophilus aerolatus]|nr:hypothetical protein [Xenophilus aerolatus]